MNKIEYDPFVTRQFSQNSGTKVNPEVKEELLEVINDAYEYASTETMLDSEWIR